MNTKKSKTNLIWMDCEMTGLDPMKDVLLEIATIITNYDLDIIARGPVLAIRVSREKLQQMDAWNRRTHKESGLLTRIDKEGVSLMEAERLTLAFITKYCAPRSAPLCGNNVGHDKRFLARYMPRVYKYLHYRIVDVSSIKVLVAQWYAGKYTPAKAELHRALDDVEASIEELRYYRLHVFVKPDD